MDAKPRIIDGNADLTATVDMGAYETGDICEAVFESDLDVDGVDLAAFAGDTGDYDLTVFTADFA